MKNIFLGLLLFLLPFLLWYCDEPTDPVKPTAAQTKRLLSSDSLKTWKLDYVFNVTTDEQLSCKDLGEWSFFREGDALAIENNDSCLYSRDIIKSKYLIKVKENQLYLQLYGHSTEADTLEKFDTIQRKITFITDKEFNTEYRSNVLNADIIEKFVSTDY